MVINGEGTFNGLVKITIIEKPKITKVGAVLTPSVTKTLWNTSEAYSALSAVISTSVLTAMAGNYGGDIACLWSQDIILFADSDLGFLVNLRSRNRYLYRPSDRNIQVL